MNRNVVWLTASCLMALSLVLASCGPSAEEAEVLVPEKVEEEEEEQRVYGQLEPSALLILADKLERGEAYVQRFKHFMTGDILEKRIVGLEDGRILYIEEIPGGYEMECRYSPESARTIAQYYRDCADAGGEPSGKTYIINGKEVENPLQECGDIGECVAIDPSGNTIPMQ